MNTFYDSVFAIQKEKSDCLSQDRILPEISLLLILIFITLNLKAVERLKACDIFQSFQLSLYTEVYIWMTYCIFLLKDRRELKPREQTTIEMN